MAVQQHGRLEGAIVPDLDLEVINYTIIAFVMFLVIKAYNHFEDMVQDDENEDVVPVDSREVQLLKEIRDGIKKLNS